MTDELNCKAFPQVAWWKQRKNDKLVKPMDKMPMAEIIKLYESGFVLCDSCGKKLPIKECAYTLVDHIIHMINPIVLWSCEGCYLECKRKGEIIGECQA